MNLHVLEGEMKGSKFDKAILLVLMAGLLLACSLPIPSISKFFPGDKDQEVTPNLTMTALYAVEYASATPPAPVDMPDEPTDMPVEAATEEPTATPEVPTSTPTVTMTSSVPTVQPVFITPLNTPVSGGQSRPAGYFVAEYLPNGVKLDGIWDEWDGAQYPANYIPYGYDNWTGEEDLSASFRVGWNEKFLFIAAKVRDDVYVQNAQYHDIYKGDSLEILLDTDLYGDFNYDELNGDDYQLGISPGRPDVNGMREAYMWYPYVIAGSRPEVGIGATKVDDVYRVEVAIPWTLFNSVPSMGRHFGFAFSVSDDDLINTIAQETMASCVSGRKLTHPMTWGELVLGQ
jgi:cellulose/xylan binding protein with CBM9 domain